jgi:hypothetical protein
MDGISEKILENLAKKEKKFTLLNGISGKVVIINECYRWIIFTLVSIFIE